jgi:serine phosphatase RsbU (regulator of sigma subunit)
MKKLQFVYVFILVLLSASSFGQSTASTRNAQYEEIARNWIDKSRLKLDLPKQEVSRQLALEALEAAEISENADLRTEAALLLAEIHKLRKDKYQSLEYAQMAFLCSEGAQENYRVASGINLINLYNELGAVENSAVIAEKLLTSEALDSGTRKLLLKTKAFACEKRGDLDGAQAIWLSMLNDAREKPKDELLVTVLEHLSQNATSLGKYTDADKYESELYYLMLRAGKLEQAAVCANNMALINHKAGNYKVALYNFDMALESCKNYSGTWSNILINKAATCLKLDDPDQAESLVEESIRIAEKLNLSSLLGKAKLTLATLLKNKSNFNEAIFNSRAALDIAKQTNDNKLRLSALDLLGQIALSKGDKSEFNEYTKSHKELADLLARQADQEAGAKSNLMLALEKSERSVLNYLALVREKNLQQKKNELFIQNKAKDASILSIQQELHLTELERIDISRKNAQRSLELAQAELREQQQKSAIVELEKDKSAQLLSLTKLELDKQEQLSDIALLNKQNQVLTTESQLKQEQAKRSRQLALAGSLIGILLIVGLVFSFKAYLRHKKNNRIIREQSDSLEQSHEILKEKNEDILSSITYASFFQSTIIPQEDELKKTFKEAFIHYKPLDIVSGDLPFLYERNNIVYLAAIDCIGHGVPAAMLSFMVHYSLVDIINNEQHLQPGEMLKKLNDVILSKLEREAHRDFNAGADVGLLSYNKGTGVTLFSGAQSPLIIQSVEGTTRLKGDPYSIGDMVMKQNVQFTTQKVELKKGSRAYLMSDGFIHQHSGELANKKFGTKKLMDIIREKSGRKMTEIKARLGEAHDLWKGSAAQTDDIMLIGIEI